MVLYFCFEFIFLSTQKVHGFYFVVCICQFGKWHSRSFAQCHFASLLLLLTHFTSIATRFSEFLSNQKCLFSKLKAKGLSKNAQGVGHCARKHVPIEINVFKILFAVDFGGIYGGLHDSCLSMATQHYHCVSMCYTCSSISLVP